MTVDGRPARLFDVFRGPQWTLLAFGDTAAGHRLGPAARAYAADSLDSEGHVRSAYDATDGTLMLIRPDGYVGLVADTVEQVEEYWSAVHGRMTVV